MKLSPYTFLSTIALGTQSVHTQRPKYLDFKIQVITLYLCVNEAIIVNTFPTMSVYVCLKQIEINTPRNLYGEWWKVEELKSEFTPCLRSWNTHSWYFGLNSWKENPHNLMRVSDTFHNNFMNDVYLWIFISSICMYVCVWEREDRVTIVGPLHATHNHYRRVSV